MYEHQQWRQVRFITFYGNLLELNCLLYKNIWFSLYHNHLARYASCCPSYYLFARNLSIDNYLWTLNHERIELFLFRGRVGPWTFNFKISVLQCLSNSGLALEAVGGGKTRSGAALQMLKGKTTEYTYWWLVGLFRLFRMTRSATHRTDLK